MDFNYLFYQDIPKGVKSIYVNGKRIPIEEFNKAKSEFLLKRNPKIKSRSIVKK